MTFEQFTRYCLQSSTKLYDAYTQLLVVPKKVDIAMNAGIASVLDDGERSKAVAVLTGGGSCKNAIGDTWIRFNLYQLWIISLYSSEIIEKFGGLNVVEKGLLPTGGDYAQRVSIQMTRLRQR